MEVQWKITNVDVLKINEIISSQSNSSLFLERIDKNVNINNLPSFDFKIFWKAMVACLLSSQQRSGPESPLTKFCSTIPFPLNLEKCSLYSNELDIYVKNILMDFGGIRRAKTIGKQVEENYEWLNNEGWYKIKFIFDELLDLRKRDPQNEDIHLEREAADFIRNNLKGFGPKQSRNLWQTLGLFRYEIPIDSRIIKWLNKDIFPFKLSSQGLSDINYYEFVMTGIQSFCEECNVLPCLFDAAIFSSYDPEWNKEFIW